MKEKISKVLAKYGEMLCVVAVTVATIVPFCCRGAWYQPKEPNGFENFLKNKS